MSFQSRTVIALALCALIFVLFDWLGPKPAPTPEGEAVATEDAKDDTKAADTKTDAAPVEAEEAEAPVGNVAAVDRELRNDLIAVRLSNRSP